MLATVSCSSLAPGDLARSEVQHAQHAQLLTLRRFQRSAGVEAQVRRTGDHPVVAEPRVFQGIGNDQRIPLADRVAADRHVQRCLAQLRAQRRLEPLPVVIDQADHGQRRVADIGRQAREIIELGLLRRVEDVVSVERGETRGLIRRSRKFAHARRESDFFKSLIHHPPRAKMQIQPAGGERSRDRGPGGSVVDSYCLEVTINVRLRQCASGLTPRAVLEKLRPSSHPSGKTG